MMRRLPRVKPGEPIKAEHVNAVYDAAESLEIVGVPPIMVEGNEIRYDGLPPGFWIQITGAPSGAKHPWREVFPVSGGSWTNGSRTGTTSTDSAYEINGSTATLTNKYARAWRDQATQEIRFHYSTC